MRCHKAWVHSLLFVRPAYIFIDSSLTCTDSVVIIIINELLEVLFSVVRPCLCVCTCIRAKTEKNYTNQKLMLLHEYVYGKL